MLVVFDVDGTLTRTSEMDAEIYAATFEAVFGARLPSTDWSTYRCPTDRGIADEAVERLRLDPGRVADFERRFVAAIASELARRGALAVPGAADMLRRLAAGGHAIALATGAYEASARAKLDAAGIEIAGAVLVGSGFDASREAVLREAIRRAGGSGRAVSVGDGPWDVRAARALGLPFVGVDPEGTGALGRAGVAFVVRDFRDAEAFVAALRDAPVP